MKQMHPSVVAAAQGFRVIGMGTPRAVAEKCELLLHPKNPGERVVVVIGDAIRCSSTLIAILAAGAAAITVTEKAGEAGTTADQALRAAQALGVEMVTGGELHGQPIPGGAVGNSPVEIVPERLLGRLVHFSSTNFGACYTQIVDKAWRFTLAGGSIEVVVATLWNATAVGRYVASRHPHRIFLGFGGFYDFPSVEDHLLGGIVLGEAFLGDLSELDDDARLMWCAALGAREVGIRRVVDGNWISRALAAFGREVDVEVAVSSHGLSESIRQKVSGLIPRVEFFEGVPLMVAASDRTTDGSCDRPAQPTRLKETGDDEEQYGLYQHLI